MRTILPLCLIFIFSAVLISPAQATTISGVKTLTTPTVMGTQQQETESEGKTTQTKDASPAPAKPGPALPGKTVSPVLPTTRLPATKTPTSKMVVSPKPGLLAPGAPKSPLGQRVQPQMKQPLLTKPGMMKPGVKGATSVSGVTVGKMQGPKEAALLVRGKGLGGITSALLFLNNRPVGDVTLKRGLASDTSLKISMTSSKGALVNKGTAGPGNYELRLRAGMQEFKVFTPIGAAVVTGKNDLARVGFIPGTVDRQQPNDGSGGSSPPAETPPEEGSEGSTPPAGNQPDGPDLIVSDIRQSPPNPVEGQGFNYNIDITNQGNWAATFPSNTKLIETSINQSFWAWSMGQGGGINLLPGQTYTVTQNASPVNVGTNPVWARVDPENAVTESNESNNETQGSYTVLAAQGPPDLVITDIQTSPVNPSMATGFSLVITVENLGTSAVEFNQNVDILKTIGTNNILKEGFLRISPGIHTINVMALNIAPGPFNWTVMVDPQNVVSETDESNNTFNISGTISSN